MGFDLLIELKKTNKKPKAGDVFVLKPRDNIYCFGKVIITGVESRDSFVNGMNLIFIYDYFSATEEVPSDIENNDILLVHVVNHQLWRKGYAKNVAFSEVTEKEINEDYGFWDICKKEYVNLMKDRINRIPKYKGIFGLGSYGIVGKDLNRILNDRLSNNTM